MRMCEAELARVGEVIDKARVVDRCAMSLGLRLEVAHLQVAESKSCISGAQAEAGHRPMGKL